MHSNKHQESYTNVEAWLNNINCEPEQNMSMNYRRLSPSDQDNVKLNSVVVRKQSAHHRDMSNGERNCIYFENPTFPYLNYCGDDTSNSSGIDRQSYPPGVVNKRRDKCASLQIDPTQPQQRTINDIFDNDRQSGEPKPPMRSKRRKEWNSAGESSERAGNKPESIYENIWDLGIDHLDTRIQYFQLENESETSSICYTDSPPPDYHQVMKSSQQTSDTGKQLDSNNYRTYSSSSNFSPSDKFQNSFVNKRQGIDFEYYQFPPNEEIDFDFHTSSSSSSSAASSSPILSTSENKVNVIYANIVPKSVNKTLYSSAPSLYYNTNSAALTLCTAEEVCYTCESTTSLSDSTLLTETKLDSLRDHVTVRKNSITSDIIQWSYELFRKAIRSSTEDVDLEEKSLLDLEYPIRSKSATSSPIQLRKADSKIQVVKSRHQSLVESQQINNNLVNNLNSNINTLQIIKEGSISRSKIVDSNKKQKKWIQKTYACLTSKSFFLFESKEIFNVLKTGAKGRRNYDMKIELQHCVLRNKSEFTSRKNIIALINIENGSQILLQLDDKDVADEWQKIIHNQLIHFEMMLPHKVTLPESEEELQTPPKDQRRITSKLKNFFSGRNHSVDNLDRLDSKDVTPVFGSTLEKLCVKMNRPKVPKFVKLCIEAIEPYLETEGLYRASGNLSLINKIRSEVDQNQYQNVNGEKVDVHVLTGVLKLFFRELKTSVIPTHEYDEITTVSNYADTKAIIHQVKIILNRLPESHHDTLQFLITHLLKVSKFATNNRMDVTNLATVWAPNLIQQYPSDSKEAAVVCPFVECTVQMKLIRILLSNYNDIFNDT